MTLHRIALAAASRSRRSFCPPMPTSNPASQACAGAAAAKGVSAQTFDQLTQGLDANPDVIKAEGYQPEFKTAIWDYLAGLVDEERVQDGQAAMQQNAQALDSAQRRFGVPPYVVAAVWGVESNFGRNFGSKPVIQSLATLSCSSRRAAYYRGELFAAMKIVQSGDIDPRDFNGSWAGAFGHTQFMPSTFLGTAVDGDGDGRRDLVHSAPDALASTANFLKKAGWQQGQTWGFEVKLPGGYHGSSGRTKKMPNSFWASQGISRIDGRAVSAMVRLACFCLLVPTGLRFW